jgi:hypothetical protein
MTAVSGSPFSQNLANTPDPDAEYYLGGIKAYVSKLDSDDEEDGDGLVDLGNVVEVQVIPTSERMEHQSSQEGRKTVDWSVILGQKFEVKFKAQNLNEYNTALWLTSTPVDETNAGVLGIVEYEMISAAKWGRWYPILDSNGVRARNLAAADVVVELQGASTVTAAGGRTLTFAASGKTITASTGSFITDGYRVGRTLVVAGSSSNNGSYTIATVTALVITVVQTLVNEGPLSATATLNSVDVALTLDTDYEVLGRRGLMRLLVSSAHVDEGCPVDVTVTANPLAETTRTIPVQSSEPIAVALYIFGRNRKTGREAELRVPKITLSPDGPLVLEGSDKISEMGFTGFAELKDGESQVGYFTALGVGELT